MIIQNRDLHEIEPRLPQTSVIHYHGTNTIEGALRDHQPVQFNRDIFRLLENFTGILTIENYHPTLFKQNRDQLENYF